MDEVEKYYLPSNDYFFKALLIRNPNLLRELLSAILPDLIDKSALLEIENPDLVDEYVDGKLVKLDLLVTTATGERINIEMQVDNEAHIEDRMQFYLARTHAIQLDRGENSSKIRPTYSIWLCKFSLHDDEHCKHDFILYDPKCKLACKNSIHLIQLEVRKYLLATGKLRDWLELYAANTREDVMELATRNEVMQETCGILAQMNMSRRERAIAESRERYLFEKRSAYSAGVDDGMEKGMEKGENRHARQVACKMLKCNEPMASIVNYSGLPEEEIFKLARDMGL